MNKKKIAVIHYGEIGLKGKNKAYFVKKLLENVKRACQSFKTEIFPEHDKIILGFSSQRETEEIKEVLKRIPGISYFAVGREASLKQEDILKAIFLLLEKEKFSTFKVNTRRSNKKFQPNSQQLNELLGEKISLKKKKKVKLENPDQTVFVEIGERKALVYLKKIQGIGGLPVGSSGKAIVSLSGGIDSPVASYLAMKRGLEVVFVHLFHPSVQEKNSFSKMKKIVGELKKFQGKAKIYFVPFKEIQKLVIANIPSCWRMIVYRRFMMRIANEIAKKEKAGGIVTGDSLGQVASQTLENLNCIYQVSRLPVLPPLIGMDKVEIVNLARKIGTYNHSIIPYQDCCSFLVAKHPETKGNIGKIESLEKLIPDIEYLVYDCVGKAVTSCK